MAKLEILVSAMNDLRTIASVYQNTQNKKTASKIIANIFTDLSRLETFPYSGKPVEDKELRMREFRCIISGKYICIYRVINDTVFVYHIAHSKQNYPFLLHDISDD